MAGGLSGFPVIGEEVAEPVHGVGADAVEDVAEVGEGVYLESFARGDEAAQDRGGSSACLEPSKVSEIPFVIFEHPLFVEKCELGTSVADPLQYSDTSGIQLRCSAEFDFIQNVRLRLSGNLKPLPWLVPMPPEMKWWLEGQYEIQYLPGSCVFPEASERNIMSEEYVYFIPT